MNLQHTIDLHAGGPGSGRHPEGAEEWKDVQVVAPEGFGVTYHPVDSLTQTKDVRKDKLDAMKKELREGKFYPLVIDKDKNVLDGHHRFAAAKALGFKTVPAIKLAIGVKDILK